MALQYNQSPEAALAFANLFRSLGTAPIMRIGGRSQETITEVPGTLTWQTLAQLRQSVNMKFIVGLPLERGDVKLARGVMEAARSYLGDAIIGFGLGNEPGARACVRVRAGGPPGPGEGHKAARLGGGRTAPLSGHPFDASCCMGSPRAALTSGDRNPCRAPSHVDIRRRRL